MADAYPLQRLFFDLPEQDVLDIRDKAVALIKEGKTIMEVSSGSGASSTRQFAMPPAQMLFEARAALRSINPAVYGRRRTRTYARLTNF